MRWVSRINNGFFFSRAAPLHICCSSSTFFPCLPAALVWFFRMRRCFFLLASVQWVIVCFFLSTGGRNRFVFSSCPSFAYIFRSYPEKIYNDKLFIMNDRVRIFIGFLVSLTSFWIIPSLFQNLRTQSSLIFGSPFRGPGSKRFVDVYCLVLCFLILLHYFFFFFWWWKSLWPIMSDYSFLPLVYFLFLYSSSPKNNMQIKKTGAIFPGRWLKLLILEITFFFFFSSLLLSLWEFSVYFTK